MARNKKTRKPVTGNVTERLFRKMFSRICSKNIEAKAEYQAEVANIDRLNHTVMGDPEHSERIMLTFDPILAWLDEAESTGDMPLADDGTPILRTPNHSRGHDWCQLDSSLIAVAECFELMANDRGVPNEGRGLRQVGAKIQAGMMLYESDFTAARASIAWMVGIIKTMTPLDAESYTSTIEIRDRIAKNTHRVSN